MSDTMEQQELTTEPAAQLTEFKGAFVASLIRNNKKIRDDRAIAIVESAQIKYKRIIEDIEQEIKQKIRDRENMIDLSPTDANSLMLASDFKADDFIKKDLQIGIELRNLEIKLEIARKRFAHLFGG